jgi:Flp pilus assembly protein CpaB
MSRTLRLSVIAVMLLAAISLGLMAYTMMQPKAAPIVQAAPTPAPPATPVYFVTKYPLTEGTLVRDHYLRPVPMTEAPAGAFTPADMSKLRGSLIRKPIDAGNVITSQNVTLREDPAFFSALEKLCQDGNNRQTTTVTVYHDGKADGYSVRKTDAKGNEACNELDSTYPANKVVLR